METPATSLRSRSRTERRTSAEDSVTRLAELWSRIDASLASSDEALFARAKSISGWSVAQQVFHITLANELCFGNALALARREGMLIRPFEAVHPAALSMLEHGAIRRGSAQAPRFVRPPDGDPDLGVLREILPEVRQKLTEVTDRIDAVVSAPNCIKHQVLGDLDAVEWLRFAHVHTVHHLEIVRDVQRAIQGEAAS